MPSLKKKKMISLVGGAVVHFFWQSMESASLPDAQEHQVPFGRFHIENQSLLDGYGSKCMNLILQ